MELLQRKLAEIGYQAEPAYMDAARDNFLERLGLIQKKYNADYVQRYIRESEDKLFERLSRQYSEGMAPQEEQHTLRAADVPDDFLNGS